MQQRQQQQQQQRQQRGLRVSQVSSALILPGPHLPPPPTQPPQPEEATEIDITEPVALTFALRYLNSFALSTLKCR